jgi:hypothetical protein
MKFCQHPNCANKAVWGIKEEGETRTYNVCTKHRRNAIEGYQKLGHKVRIILLTA